MGKRLALMYVIVLSMCAVFCCGSAKRGEPFGVRKALSAEEKEGQVLFMQSCNNCHPGGEAGLGPALNNKPLPSALIKMQIRNGGGAMPSFSKERLSDEEVEKIIQYLQYSRSSRAGKP